MSISWSDQVFIKLVQIGRLEIPHHVAFIMDGNRRFAKKRGSPSWYGHVAGLHRLRSILNLHGLLGIKVLTTFAFSIDNFKRSKDEVDALMKLFLESLEEYLGEDSIVMTAKVRVRVIGDISLLPPDVKKKSIEIMQRTESHNNSVWNICIAYTAGYELTNTVRNVMVGIRSGQVKDLDVSFFSKCLFTRGDSPDLLIRTSGETRLSDFLICQLNKAHLCFLPETWPEMTSWHIFQCLLEYNYYKSVNSETPVCDVEQERFIKTLDQIEYLK